MLAENKAVVVKIGDAYDAGDLDQIRELLSPDFVGHIPIEPKTLQGPDAMIGFFEALASRSTRCQNCPLHPNSRGRSGCHSHA